MVFQEPKVEFVELMSADINTLTGPGYTVCQRIATTDVGCFEMYGDADAPDEIVCPETCMTNSQAQNWQEFNA